MIHEFHRPRSKRSFKRASCALLLLALPTLLNAASYNVTLTTDGGPGSLRQAILDANATPGHDTISIPPGTYSLSLAGSAEDAAATGDLDLTDDVDITGTPGTTLIDAQGLDRVFDLKAGTATLSGLILQNGDAMGAEGGGINIATSAILTLNQVIVRSNLALHGGGIANNGTLSLLDCSISNNVAISHGGGLRIPNSNLVTNLISRVTFTGNNAVDGGAVHTRRPLGMTNVTLSHNRASQGAGIYTLSQLTLVNATLTTNNATNLAGGIRTFGSGTASLLNCLIAGNSAQNASGIFSSLGHNFDSDGTALLAEPSDINGTLALPLDPLLGPLSDNGGLTPTHPLLSGSPAIDAGTASGTPTTDQRGVARNGTPDIGAFEFVPIPPVIQTPPENATTPIGGTAAFSVVASAPDPLSYQWLFNNQPIPDATNATLTITNVQIPNAGAYAVNISTSGGSVTSPESILHLPPTLAWTRTYNGPLNSGELLTDMVIDHLGCVYVTGISVGQGTGSDCLTAKYDPAGNEVWTARYNGPGNGGDAGNAITVGPDGSVYVAGEARSLNASQDFVTLKYDPAGNQLWARLYNSPGNGSDNARALAINPSGQIVVTGDSDGDWATLQYNPDGTSSWTNRYAGPAGGSDQPSALVVDSNASIYVTGGSFALTNGQDMTTLKYDANGNQLWAVAYSGPGNQPDSALDIALDPAQNIVITGISTGNSTATDFATIKYNPAGTQLWAARLDGPNNGPDQPAALAIDPDGNILVTGTSSTSTNSTQFSTVKYNPDGTQLWLALTGEENQDTASHIAVDLAGNSYVTGTAATTTGDDILIAKYDPAGNTVWTHYHDHLDLDDHATAIALNPAGDIVVSGTARGPDGDDYITLQLQQPGTPLLSSFPVDQDRFLGDPASFSVTITNSPDVAYQWFFNGTPLPEATNNTLNLGPTQPGDAGAYSVRISNPLGIIEPPGFTLSLLPPQLPAFTESPASQTLNPGETLTLTTAYEGGGSVRVQWRLNGVNLPNSTNLTHVVPNALPADSGSYTVTIQNEFGVIESNPALVQIATPPLLMTDLFADQITLTEPSGTGRTSSTTATVETGEPEHARKPGGKSLWITWQAPADGIASFNTGGSSFDTLLAIYTGATPDNLVEVASDEDRGGFLTSAARFNATAGTLYRVAVDGFGGTGGDIVLTWSFEASPDPLPVILTHPLSQSLPPGGDTTLSVALVTDPAGLTFQWLFNRNPIPNAQSTNLTVTNLNLTRVGRYSLQISNGPLAIESEAADLQINQTGSQTGEVQAFDKLLDVIRSGRFLLLGNPPGGGGGGGRGFAGGSGGSLSRGYSGAQTFSADGGSKEPGEPNHCGTAGGASYWIVYQAQEPGTLLLNTDGSTFDTVLTVYTGQNGQFNTLMPLTCDDNSGADGMDSALAFNVVPGTLYYIAIDGKDGASGAVQVNYSLGVPSRLTAIGKAPNGDNQLLLEGQPNGRFQISFSGDLRTWASLMITNPTTGSIELTHPGSASAPQTFYRAETLP